MENYESPRSNVENEISTIELAKIARAQKNSIYCVAAQYLLTGLPILVLFTLPFIAVSPFRQAKSVNKEPAWLYSLMGVIPILNLISLLTINAVSNRILKENGVPVGFFGVSNSYIKSIEKEHLRKAGAI